MAIPTAALAGVPAGIQANGLWIGRRQLFIRFAAEAETATMYTADALVNELGRLVARSTYHSISVSGRDPLSNTAFLSAAFRAGTVPLPMMVDCDGQRPDAVASVSAFVKLVQVTLDGSPPNATAERAVESLRQAAAAGVAHALVLAPDDSTTDGQLLRVLSQAHLAAPQVRVVVHPPSDAVEKDRRWLTFMEQAAALHVDTRLVLQLPRPSGMR